jgi:short-subunit dehydrogenase
MKQVILIVGASKGIGLEIARTLHKHGSVVYGTSRAPQTSHSHDIRLLPLDVADEASITAAVRQIMNEQGRIDVLINNAGYDLHGAAEDTTFSELFDQINTNFFGTVRVIQAVLPMMRQQNRGKIINISSIGGLMALPFNSAYAASKFAIEGYSEALRYELLPFNILVSLVEPGQVRTDTLASSNVTTQRSTTYDAREIVRHSVEAGQKASLKPTQVALTVSKIVQAARPRLRYKVRTQIRMVISMKRLFPEPVFERFIMGQFVKPLLKQGQCRRLCCCGASPHSQKHFREH